LTEEKTGAERLAERLAAIASPQRMRIIHELLGQPLHVSELARRVEMSRALLYMHLRKLEDAGFVTSELRLSEDGKAINVYSSSDFSITLTPELIAAAVEELESKEK
jgi:DNA-binding transcriptional ArsR family regulator